MVGRLLESDAWFLVSDILSLPSAPCSPFFYHEPRTLNPEPEKGRLGDLETGRKGNREDGKFGS